MSQTNQSDQSDHIMVDIETLDTEESAVILSIGACAISPNRYRPTFYDEISIQHQLDMGRTKSESTVTWWATQPSPPLNGSFILSDILIEFGKWIAACSAEPIIWAKGIDFDTKILAHAYKQCRLPVPWKYNSVRDFRTVKKLFNESISSDIINAQAHNALEDAIFQAKQLLSIELVLK